MPSEPIGILIPAFGAARTIEAIVKGALAHGHDLLVVDDGSLDGSGEAAAAAGARVIRHGTNRGKGAALATGFASHLARGAAAVITLDADGQHDPGEIPRFVDRFRQDRPDLIIGARLEAFAVMSGGRRFGNRFSTAAVRFFRGPRLPDTQCGFRLYSRAFLEKTRFRRRRYDAEIELLMRAASGGHRVASLPIRTPSPDGRETSHYRPWLDTYKMCWAVVHYSLVESRSRRRARP